MPLGSQAQGKVANWKTLLHVTLNVNHGTGDISVKFSSHINPYSKVTATHTTSS